MRCDAQSHLLLLAHYSAVEYDTASASVRAADSRNHKAPGVDQSGSTAVYHDEPGFNGKPQVRFLLKIIDFVQKTMNPVLKTMDFVLKLDEILRESSGSQRW